MCNSARRACLCAAAFLLISGARAEDPQGTAPPPITMHLTSVHPRDAIAELVKQTDVSVQIWPENLYEQQRGPGNMLPQSVDVNADGRPFWSVLDDICTGAKLFPQNMGNNASVTLQESNGRSAFGRRPQSVGALATVVADSLQRNHTIALDSDNPQVQRSCGATLVAYVDPRVGMIKFQNQPNIEKAEDENSQSIAVAPTGQPGWNDAWCKWMVQNTFVPLDYDPQTSHKLATLKGSIRVTVAADVDKIEFTDLENAEGTEKEAAGVKVACQEFKQEGNSAHMKVRITRTEMSKEMFRTLFGRIFNDGKFVTADGKRLQVSGGGGGGDDGLSYTLDCNFGNENDKPVKLIWEITTRTEEIDLPFEFHDLPLP